MNGPRGYYAKWNKSDIDNEIPYDFIYMLNLKNKINDQKRRKLIETQNILMVARWKEGWEYKWKGGRD